MARCLSTRGNRSLLTRGVVSTPIVSNFLRRPARLARGGAFVHPDRPSRPSALSWAARSLGCPNRQRPALPATRPPDRQQSRAVSLTSTEYFANLEPAPVHAKGRTDDATRE